MKVLLQASRAGQYSGAAAVARAVVRKGGPRALYRGFAAPLLGGAAETAVNYAVYGAVRRRLDAAGAPPLPSCLLAGGVAGAALSLILSPVELLKCRVQTGADASVRAALRRTLRCHGPTGLAHGLVPTLAREIPGNAIFFATYEAAMEAASATALPRGAAAPLCGGLAGVVYWMAVLPLDSAKTRIQVASPTSAAGKAGLVKTMRATYRSKGFSAGLYAGARPVLLKAFIANAVQWATWEAASGWLSPPVAVPTLVLAQAAQAVEGGSSGGGGGGGGGDVDAGRVLEAAAAEAEAAAAAEAAAPPQGDGGAAVDPVGAAAVRSGDRSSGDAGIRSWWERLRR